MTSRLLAVALLSGGCATSLTTMQTARTLDPGQVQVAASASLPVATSLVGEVVDTGAAVADRLSDAARRGEPITVEEERQAFETALALTLFQPGAYTELMARYGVVEDVDVGLRWGGFLLKADGKWRFHRERELQLAVQGGYTLHLSPAPSYASAAVELLEFVGLGDYSRHDLDVAVLASYELGEESEYGGLFAGAKYLVGFLSLDPRIRDVEVIAGAPTTELDPTLQMAGGVFGLNVGYRWVFLHLELAVLRVFFSPVILGDERDLSGFVVSPAAGLSARF